MTSLPLVADYGSGSDSDGESDPGSNAVSQTGTDPGRLNENSSSPGGNLLGLNDQSDDSSSGEDQANNQKIPAISKQKTEMGSLPNPFGSSNKLPAPSLNVEKEQGRKDLEGSVFANPFEKARQAKLSILEKHVKMTEREQQGQNTTQKRNICYKFLKGKCNFGDKCRFHHDKDATASSKNFVPVMGQQNQLNAHFYNQAGNFVQSRPEQEQQDEDSYMANMKRKKRAGVNDHLIPPKKALQSLGQQRAKERPWTVGT